MHADPHDDSWLTHMMTQVQEAADVDDMIKQLEALGGPVSLAPSWSDSDDGSTLQYNSTAGTGLEKLAGTWRLLYTSGFNTGAEGTMGKGVRAADACVHAHM